MIAGAEGFGITYPVAIDNSLSTWTNYRNRYWPAHYLIDAEGTVRHIKFGEGDYATTEKLIRELLLQADPSRQLPAATDIADTTPQLGTTTPETYLGTTKQVNFGGAEKYRTATTNFALPAQQADDSFALDGEWALGTQSIAPVGPAAATVRLNYTGEEVRMVLSGEGTITVTANGKTREIPVSGTPNSYEIVQTDSPSSGTLEVRVTPGIQAYSFTFG